MALSRASIARLSSITRCCATGTIMMTLWSLPVAAQQGTVAVTGDGTATILRPSVTDDDKAKSKQTKKKSAPAPKEEDTETASREPPPAASGGGHSIVALVNDEPVTGFEIEQRAMMLSGSTVAEKAKANFQAIVKNPRTSERLKAILNETIKANEGKSRDAIIAIFEKRKKEFGMSLQKQAFESARASALPGVKKQALEELIDERLKVQEAKKQKVTIDDADVNKIIGSIAERNKMSLSEFTQRIGGNIDVMKTRIRATLSWNEVVKRRFGPLINVTSRDVDKLVATSAIGTPQDDVELQLQRIRITMPAKLEEHGIAKRIQEADNIRTKFAGCKSTREISIGVAGAKFEEVGKRRPSSFPEPTRSLLLNASDGEMLPPSVDDGAVELWVVCSRTAVKAEDEKRDKAEGELKQKEFEVMAKRYLKDLREDAHIEYR
jgi:peptidyl-prolyl cis-trans isomerase SurA